VKVKEAKVQRSERKLRALREQFDANWNSFIDADGGIEKLETEQNSFPGKLQIWISREEIHPMEIECSNLKLTDFENRTSMIPYLWNSFSRN
jgi:hypothetical protein